MRVGETPKRISASCWAADFDAVAGAFAAVGAAGDPWGLEGDGPWQALRKVSVAAIMPAVMWGPDMLRNRVLNVGNLIYASSWASAVATLPVAALQNAPLGK